MGSGGGGTSTQYTQSPEQAAVYKAAMPLLQKIFGTALPGGDTGFDPAWYMKQYPDVAKGWASGDALSHYNMYGKAEGRLPMAPSQATGTASKQVWDVGEAPMPTQDWWNNISPDVKAGLWAPWNEAANQMMETMGSGGQLGSARGGYAGTGENALGRLYADAGKDVGLQAWGMTSPGATAQWSMEQEATQFPYKILPGLLGGTYSQGVTTPNSGGFNLGGAASGGMMGGLGGSAMGLTMAANPVMLPMMMGLGALGGGMGGK